MNRKILVAGVITLLALALAGYLYTVWRSLPIQTIDGAGSAAWAPDGRSFLYLTDDRAREVFRYDLATRRATRLPVALCLPGFAISPDGRRLTFVDDDNAVWLVEPGTTNQRILYHLPPGDPFDPAFSLILAEWAPHPRIHLYRYARGLREPDSLLLDPDTGAVTRLPVSAAIVGEEETLCVIGQPEAWSLYDLRTGTERPLPPEAQPFNDDFYFLSEERLICRLVKLWQVTPLHYGYNTTFYRVDSRTLAAQRWRHVPAGAAAHLEIAPDERHCFIIGARPHGPGQLAVYRIW